MYAVKRIAYIFDIELRIKVEKSIKIVGCYKEKQPALDRAKTLTDGIDEIEAELSRVTSIKSSERNKEERKFLDNYYLFNMEDVRRYEVETISFY